MAYLLTEDHFLTEKIEFFCTEFFKKEINISFKKFLYLNESEPFLLPFIFDFGLYYRFKDDKEAVALKEKFEKSMFDFLKKENFLGAFSSTFFYYVNGGDGLQSIKAPSSLFPTNNQSEFNDKIIYLSDKILNLKKDLNRINEIFPFPTNTGYLKISHKQKTKFHYFYIVFNDDGSYSFEIESFLHKEIRFKCNLEDFKSLKKVQLLKYKELEDLKDKMAPIIKELDPEAKIGRNKMIILNELYNFVFEYDPFEKKYLVSFLGSKLISESIIDLETSFYNLVNENVKKTRLKKIFTVEPLNSLQKFYFDLFEVFIDKPDLYKKTNSMLVNDISFEQFENIISLNFNNNIQYLDQDLSSFKINKKIKDPQLIKMDSLLIAKSKTKNKFEILY